ncbi:MAG: DUF420 domain-containing protein [Planctomycetota bacterium]|jgi:uncharacterized membrane protein YozB (DUF420 family)
MNVHRPWNAELSSLSPLQTEADALEQTVTEVGTPAPEETSSLPLIEACLNGAATVLLIAGIVAIKGGKRELHERCMQFAFLASAAFLAIYLYYHFAVQPELGPRKFNGEGLAKGAYLALLITHVIGAIVNLPMVLRTFYLAWNERWDDHKRWAKFTFPLWFYVSVTGVVVYLVLYPFNPAP